LIGTPSYMSPEQLRGEVVDGRADVFAAGIVLYQLLTGSRPFFGSISTVMQQILNETPTNPTEKNTQLGGEFDALVQKALAKNANDRYASAQQFLDALQLTYRSFNARASNGLELGDFNDRTIIASPAPPPALTSHADAAHGDTASTRSRSASSYPALTPWQQEILPELQSLLSAQVGPIAKILVRDAMKSATNIDRLCQKLLPHIQSEKGRLQFLDGIRGIGKAHIPATHPAPPAAEQNARADSLKVPSGFVSDGANASGNRTAASAVSLGLEPAFIELAERALTAHIGPIAKVVTKRAAKQTADRQEFLRLLAENISSPSNQQKFLHDLG